MSKEKIGHRTVKKKWSKIEINKSCSRKAHSDFNKNRTKWKEWLSIENNRGENKKNKMIYEITAECR